MSNYLDNGTVLPHGLLSQSERAGMAGFNKSYKNTGLRVGVIVKRFDVDDPDNRSGLTVEYNVVATEQEAGSGITTTLYRNCLSMDGLGSIADFFERTLRPQKTKTSKGQTQTFNDQDGAIVFLLCIDGTSDRAVIIGGLNHPDRKTTLQGDEMHLEGEFNGVNIKVEDDGSATLTFNGTTDSQGKPTDSTQGTTQFSIEKDGSFQFMHDAITARYDRKGQATVTAKDDITEDTQTNYNVKTGKDVNVTAQGNGNINVTKLVMAASGDASLASQNCDIAAQSALTVEGSTIKLTAQSMASVKAANIVMDGMVALGGQGGQPLLLLSAMILGVGNLGAPVISQAISGFTTKVVAT